MYFLLLTFVSVFTSSCVEYAAVLDVGFRYISLLLYYGKLVVKDAIKFNVFVFSTIKLHELGKI
jgi:hypothetical protein